MILWVLPLATFVVMLLIFPAAHGSFASTHGPVSALRSLKAALLLFMALTGLSLLGFSIARKLRLIALTADALGCLSPDRQSCCSLRC